MSQNSNTDEPVELVGEAEKTVEIYVTSDQANEILAGFEVPMPDAADLTEIRLIIRDSSIVVGNWQTLPPSEK